MDKIKRYKTEVDELKEKFSLITESNLKKNDPAKIEHENFLKNTELVKDVESLIITEEDEFYQNQLKDIKSSNVLKNCILPEYIEGESTLSEQMNFVEDYVEEDYTLVGSKNALKMKNDQILKDKGIYRLFFDNVESLKQVDRQKRNTKFDHLTNSLEGHFQNGRFDQKFATKKLVFTNEKMKNVINNNNIVLSRIPDVENINMTRKVIEKDIKNNYEIENFEEDKLFLQNDENPEAFLYDYIKLPNIETYSQKSNIASLKATSFFDNAILFENDLVSISCITTKKVEGRNIKVDLFLTFRAKMNDVYLSTYVESVERVECFPHAIHQELILAEKTQTFTFEMLGNQKIIDFPLLRINLAIGYERIFYKVLLPFSVNKMFVESSDFEEIWTCLSQVI